VRTLLYIPIIHTEADLGTAVGLVREEYIRKHGENKYEEHTKAISSMWERIREKLSQIELDYEKVRIYQDGLPVCGKELEIAREIAVLGSENHRIVLELVEKGARLEGTEDPELLLKEYNNLKKIKEKKDSTQGEKVTKSYARQGRKLLTARDKYIARRIDATLREGEMGILFMGLLHEVDRYLAKDIEIKYVIARLPFKRGTESINR
jgi:hypothetical protein